MNKILKEKIMEAFLSVLPITVIVILISIVLVPIPTGTLMLFLGGAALLIIGMGFFSLGVDMAMIPMGEGIGVQMTKSSRLFLIILVGFAMGIMITVAEPSLMVLAHQISAIPYFFIIFTVAVGVGFYLVLAILRTLFRIRFSTLLIISYLVCFILAYFNPDIFIPVGFESGSVVTGPIAVPFVLAIGLGLASVRSDKGSVEDSFGLVALVLVGPVISMLLLGIFYEPASMDMGLMLVREVDTSQDVAGAFTSVLPGQLREVSMAMGVILFCFLLLQLKSRRYSRHQLRRILIGFIYTLIGLVVFLTGVNVGFIPVGQLLGSELAASTFGWVLIPLGGLIGYFIVAAEPAVHVLTKQVEEISGGAITTKMMYRGLAIGMGVAVALAMMRILFGIQLLWIIIPGYLFALALSFFVPKIFTAVAFDSGAVCTGPMSATFLLPIAMGVADGSGRDLMLFAIGIVTIVAMTPPVIIQLMGLFHQLKVSHAASAMVEVDRILDFNEIIILREER
ncbi:MAG: DUF1538 domain-containing protein [Treponema sp.]|nr:DUF1538 domain-containing protein [Treponema sp.]